MTKPWFLMKHFRTPGLRDEITFEHARTVLDQPEIGLFKTNFKIDFIYRVKGIVNPGCKPGEYRSEIEIVETVTFQVSRFNSKQHQLKTEISFYEVHMFVDPEAKEKILPLFEKYRTRNEIRNRIF